MANLEISQLLSHPDKALLTHVNGVIENTRKLTLGLGCTKWSELVAIFHDLGKINPNFQKKLLSQGNNGYSNHAYLSAYSFYATFLFDKHNFQILKKWLNTEFLTTNELILLTTIIAKHHGDLPNLCGESTHELDFSILDKKEIWNLFNFIDEYYQELLIEEYAKSFFGFKDLKKIKHLMQDVKGKEHFINNTNFNPNQQNNHLDLYLDILFTFSVLIQSDKTDAMNSNHINEDIFTTNKFCTLFPKILEKYILKFKPNSQLNKLRTQIREECVNNVKKSLNNNKRVFELTSPTGSGKTITLLSIASQIVKQKGTYRIIYALPFLSITEQVENEVLNIFKDYREDNFVQRIDSKSENNEFNRIQNELDGDPDLKKINELEFLNFKEKVFGYPFIITTFVRLFETFLSNKNATLLKLTNFSKSIFLIDEIQSLPPRLYTFFVAFIAKFCEKFDSYAVISTATQPNYNLPNDEKILSFFNSFEYPVTLLDSKKYFLHSTFNRYKLNYLQKPILIEDLADLIINEDNSVLIILNTIDDSKNLYSILLNQFPKDELFLLNTHFTPNDRIKKIKTIKERLVSNDRTILISTQLIEAGVDIDFPVLYRDFALVPNIIQSAGRCNRNGKLSEFGKVVLFNLIKNGINRADIIYGKDRDLLTFTKNALGNTLVFEENQLQNVQKYFFDNIALNLNFGKHVQKKYNLKFDFIEDMKNFSFSKIGHFQLIDEQEYGELKRYYVPLNSSDLNFQILLDLNSEIKTKYSLSNSDWNSLKLLKYKIQNHLKIMANQIVQIRLRKNDSPPKTNANYYDLQLIDLESYSYDSGIILSVNNQFI